MREFSLWIDGRRQAADDGATFESINPATEQPWAVVAAAGIADVDKAVAAAVRAHESGVWRNKTAHERAEVLNKIADLLIEHQDDLVMAEVQDSGGTFRKANIADIPATMGNFQYYAELITQQPQEVETEEEVPVPSRNIVRREPVGVVAAIVPFNFPMAAASFKIAPALAAGCTVVIKPSPYTPATTLMLAEIAKEAGVPDGVLNVVVGPSVEIGSHLVNHPDVDKVSFTGSTSVGKIVNRDCSDKLRRVTLELGGKSANIILDDANLDGAASGVLWATFFHSGQICQSGTRVLVQESILAQFTEMVLERAKKLKVGDPMDMGTQMGPVISQRQLDSIERYVEMAKAAGATCILGGKRPEGLDTGFYYEPTIFVTDDNTLRVCQEEIFGPVVIIVPVKDDEHAISIANDSLYGLAGAVWSADIDRALSIARRIEAGTIWINDFHLLKPQYPFGGYKQSGIGRELGPEGLAAYQEVKHIHVGEATGADEKYYMGILLDSLD